MDFEFSVIVESIPALLAGAKLTCIITILGISGGMVFGILAGLGRIAGTESLGEKPHGIFQPISVLIRYISSGYVETIRGTPIIVQAMFLYFAFPMLVKAATGIERFRIEALTAAVITIIINAGAYIAEIVRGSVVSVNKGLLEAGMSLGISRFQLIVHIIGPIAFRRMIPPLIAERYVMECKTKITAKISEMFARWPRSTSSLIADSIPIIPPASTHCTPRVNDCVG